MTLLDKQIQLLKTGDGREKTSAARVLAERGEENLLAWFAGDIKQERGGNLDQVKEMVLYLAGYCGRC